ncbi:MAG: PLP-dependent aminotransferase family protein [Eubacteriales bacterium]|nr:PLP-dependent aminotransferase family protein [Eubacteriales bacterium]
MRAILPIFDESRKTPYYLQLYHYLKDAILKGEMLEGERLPSLRSLAKSTGLSVTTIEQSYNQLLVEGYISVRPGSGYYVSRINAAPSQTVPAVSDILAKEVLVLEEPRDEDSPAMLYDPECFDFNKWKKCMNKILTDYSPALFFEGEPQGEIGLRTEIARYLYTSRGVSCTPEQIIIAAGTQQITNHLATLLRLKGVENVAIENPGYMPVRNIFRDRGFAITSVDVGADGLKLEKLPANIRTAAYVSPSNHAFTGASMPIGRRNELLQWASDNNSYIIEDDYDSELRYFSKPIPALKSLDGSDRVIYLGSFSSTLFAAVKISYMVLPISMAREFGHIAGDYSQTCSKLEQLSLAMFMESGHYQTHIKKLRKLYSQKLAKLTEAFARFGKGCVEVTNTSSGINVILKIYSRKPARQLKKDAESLGIPSMFIGNYDPSGNTSHSIHAAVLILYYNQIPLEKIPGVVQALVSAWRD